MFVNLIKLELISVDCIVDWTSLCCCERLPTDEATTLDNTSRAEESPD
jgi:hypothetical protein